jgi:hypothetical protein
MSTEDRPDEQPEFPKDDTTASSSASVPPPMPEIPAWQAPADSTPASPIPIPDPIQMPTAAATPAAEPSIDEREPHSTPAPEADTPTRPPLGGPYVVTQSGAPVAEQATTAYEREPSRGPRVTSSEPAAESPSAHARTPYPAAAFAPAAASAPAAEAPAGSQPGYAPYQPVPQPLAPQPPRPRGNRGVGSLIALAGTAVFAVVYAGVAFLIIAANLAGAAAVSAFTSFLLSAAFIVPVVVFAIALVLIVLIVNRAGWWAYVLGGFLVAVLVYVAGIAGALVHVNAWNWQPQEQYEFVRSLTMDPLTLAGAIIARETAIWTGAWIAFRGRRLKAKNAAEREEFERTRSEAAADSQRDGAAPITTW